MTVSFYNERGTMGGADIHKDPATQVPMPFNVHITFSHPTYMLTKKADYLSMDGAKALKSGMDFYVVPHTYPGSFIVEAVSTMLSGSKAWMSVHSVTYNGDKAATCIAGPMSCNVNCNEFVDSPYGNVVTNLNSVVTQPTYGDYYGSWIGAWVDIGLGWGIGKGAEKLGGRVPKKWKDVAENAIKQIWRRAPDAFPILDIPGRIGEYVQQQVDRALQ